MILPAIALGAGAAAVWIAVLAVSHHTPSVQLWPPRRGNLGTAAWAWGLTALIYVGLIRAADEDWNALSLASALRWGAGGAFSLAGSVLHGWGTAALRLAGTSGWDVGVCRTGPYARQRHPQYLGQILTLAGMALLSGSAAGWVIVLVATAALVYAARVEEAHLLARHPPYAGYRDDVPSLI